MQFLNGIRNEVRSHFAEEVTSSRNIETEMIFAGWMDGGGVGGGEGCANEWCEMKSICGGSVAWSDWKCKVSMSMFVL